MAAVPGTSRTQPKSDTYNTETARFLCCVYRKVKRNLDLLRNIHDNNLSMDRLQIVTRITGLSRRSLQILEKFDHKKMKLPDPVDRSVVLVAYSLYCLQMRRLPTTKMLYANANLITKIPPYIDLTSFRKMLIEMGFVWKNPGNGSLVVIEKPLMYYERYNYLRKLIDYKKSLPVYYVDENVIYHSDSTSLAYSSLYDMPEWAIQRDDFLNYKIFVLYALSENGVKAIECIEGFSEDTFENWIMDTLLPVLQDPSLVILNNTPHHCKLLNPQPTLNSLKCEMIDFLELHNVPYDIDMSKYELYSLSQRFAKVKKNVYKIDSLLESRGHKVLRLPKQIENLTPAAPLAEVIKAELTKFDFPEDKEQKTEKLKFLLSLQFDIANGRVGKYFENIHEEIDRLYSRDVIVDQIYDEIATNSSKSTDFYEDSDVPVLSDDEAL